MTRPTVAWGAELLSTKTEEDVKFIYAQAFGLKYNTANRHDLYTESALFEFKYDKNLKSLEGRARVLAQLLYYIHELRLGDASKRIPAHLILADKNECAVTETQLWLDFVTDESYDWDLAPSIPDSRLVADLAGSPILAEMRVFDLLSLNQLKLADEAIREVLSPKLQLIKGIKKVITEDNFTDVYSYWHELFGESMGNGVKPSTYFIADIQLGKSHLIADQGKVIFELEHGEAKTKKILTRDYEHFWSLYEKVANTKEIRAIIAKIDRINDMTTRRFEGEFYTPLEFAKKGIEYLEKTIGKDWKKKRIRIWDMAAGTGNLEWYLPNEMSLELYISTLHKDEVEHCEKLFLGATCFQYDYLHDDVDKVLGSNAELVGSEWKMPQKLRDELADPEIHWIVLINPPFGTAQTAGANSKSKKSVSMTSVQKYMHEAGLGEVSRELFEQFLFRIHKEMPAERTHLGLFSKLKFINATNDQKFRDLAFQYEYKHGFMFAARNFHGTKGKFPVGFTVWDLSVRKHLEDQTIRLDVFNDQVHKIGQKTVATISKDRFLSTWIKRPRNTRTFPAFKSAINIASSNVDTRDRICEDFIGSLDCAGNDVQNVNRVGIYSGPFATAGAHSITPDNFEKSLVVHAVRRIITPTWMNDRDQFMQPVKALSEEFIADCVVWGLFAASNQTSAMQQVHYKDETYQIINHFFPFLCDEVLKWRVEDSEIGLGLMQKDDRFVAKWLAHRSLSDEARDVLASGRSVYKLYFENLAHVRTAKFKITTWDAGWWQIRNALKDADLGTAELETNTQFRKLLQAKLLQQIYSYQFIATEVDIAALEDERL